MRKRKDLILKIVKIEVVKKEIFPLSLSFSKIVSLQNNFYELTGIRTVYSKLLPFHFQLFKNCRRG